MDGGVRERVEALRLEIAEILKQNLAYLQSSRPDFSAMNDHARREQRLKDIMDELKIHDCVEEALENSFGILRHRSVFIRSRLNSLDMDYRNRNTGCGVTVASRSCTAQGTD
jgi:hypothetical protein